jgi:hypothetical protein
LKTRLSNAQHINAQQYLATLLNLRYGKEQKQLLVEQKAAVAYVRFGS